MFFWNLEAYLQVCFQVKKLAMVSSVASLAPWQWVWVKAFSVGCNLSLFCAKEICFDVWSAGGGVVEFRYFIKASRRLFFFPPGKLNFTFTLSPYSTWLD